MKILLLGSGGREYTIAWKMAQSDLLTKLYIAPGNGGTESFGENVAIKGDDFNAIKSFVLDKNIEMVVVGPEAPLVAGIVDFFKSDNELKNVPVIGPDKIGATLEGSKDFAKEFMARHEIPTAAYKTFTASTVEDGKSFLETLNPPYVLKADGLAGGKGVLVLNQLDEAKQELESMLLEDKFGKASSSVVIEEFLDGIELSVFVVTDGKDYLILPEAKDYKRIGEGDTGLNTGGMGAVSPVPFSKGDFLRKVEDRIVKPTINGFQKDGYDYIGFVFIGLMNVDGDPYVIEYNVRMGDPETEVVIPRIESDLVEMFKATATQNLANYTLNINPETALTVMMVSGGYPGSYPTGKEISGIENITDGIAIHAGTRKDNESVLTSGGRVLATTAFGSSIVEAQKKAYQMVDQVSFSGSYFRRDIGNDLL
ncbi:MAG: phosphoribosylamine--glycine ligase [Crocinitomicaceae bacterium]|nr:phosphoribosylamine--glycine ligase [Crocinitomicaceae bacterium]